MTDDVKYPPASDEEGVAIAGGAGRKNELTLELKFWSYVLLAQRPLGL